VTLVKLVVLVCSLLGRGEAGQAWVEVGRWLDIAPRTASEPAVQFVLELLALSRCEAPSSRGAWTSGDLRSGWRLPRAHLELERLRVVARVPDWAQRLRWEVPDPGASSAIVWPATEERWDDETPVMSLVTSRCAGARAEENATLLAETISDLLRWMPTAAPTRPALTFELAFLRYRQGAFDASEKLLVRFGAELSESELAPDERRQRRVLLALTAAELGHATMQHWLYARALGQDPYLDAQAIAAGLKQGGLAALDRARELAEQRQAEHDWFLSRAALIALRLGDETRFFQLTRKLVGGKSRAQVLASAESRELFDLAARWISRRRFDDVTLELVESLGPPAQVRERLEAVAQTAQRHAGLDNSGPVFAAAVYRWLIAHPKGTAPPIARWKGRLALAQLAGGLTPEFCATYGELATIALEEARGEPERQLLYVTRDAVAFVGDRPAHEAASCIVKALRPLLTEEARARGRTELAELERALLTHAPAPSGGDKAAPPKSGPKPEGEATRSEPQERAAAARVLAEQLGGARNPMLLGELEITAAGAALPPPPELPLPPLPGASSLLCLPDGERGCRRWAGPGMEPVQIAVSP